MAEVKPPADHEASAIEAATAAVGASIGRGDPSSVIAARAVAAARPSVAAELKANLQAAIERVEHTAAAAQEKAVAMARAEQLEEDAQLAERVGATYPRRHTHSEMDGPPCEHSHAIPFADLLRQEGGPS